MSDPEESNDSTELDDFIVFEPWFNYEAENDHFRLLFQFGDGEREHASGLEIGLTRNSVRKLMEMCEVALQIEPPSII